jgi:hypothetical protein
MSASIRGRGTVLLATVGALMIAALAMAPQSQASTVYACVKKKSGTPRIVSKSTKCKKGEKKLSWGTQGPAGKNGGTGAAGAKGETGPAATSLWAVVEFNGTLVRGGTGAVSSTSIPIAPSHYIVTFNRDVTKCAYIATPAATSATTLPPVGFDSVAPVEGNPDGVFVKTETSAGAEQQESFDLAVFC